MNNQLLRVFLDHKEAITFFRIHKNTDLTKSVIGHYELKMIVKEIELNA